MRLLLQLSRFSKTILYKLLDRPASGGDFSGSSFSDKVLKISI